MAMLVWIGFFSTNMCLMPSPAAAAGQSGRGTSVPSDTASTSAATSMARKRRSFLIGAASRVHSRLNEEDHYPIGQRQKSPAAARPGFLELASVRSVQDLR